ncbi:MAG: YesL family protein [Bilifractor sp.]|jgi:uncharacterized membrane protein YesL
MNLSSVFGNETPFGKFCAKAGAVILVNLLFILTLIPIVTAGAGLCASYYCMLILVRDGEVSVFRTFWKSFKENFKQATIAWLVTIGLVLGLLIEYNITRQMPSVFMICRVVVIAVLITVLLVAMYMGPVMSAFNGTLKQHFRNCLFFIGKNPLIAAAVAAISAVPMVLTYVYYQWIPLTSFLWCFFGFGLTVYINAALLTPLFRNYLPGLSPVLAEEEETPRETEEQVRNDMIKLGM